MKRFLKLILGTAALLAGTLSLSQSAYNQELKINLQEINQKSDIILQVQAQSMTSKWVYTAEGKNIITTTRFKVVDCIKGEYKADDSFNLDVLGGTVGDTTQYVSSSVIFSRGEESILFLKKSQTGTDVVGAFQGKFPVNNGSVTVEDQKVRSSLFVETIKNSQNNPQAIPAFIKSIKREPIEISAPSLKGGTGLKSTTDTYAVTAIKSSFTGGTDSDGDGYFDSFSFTLQINGDADPSAVVYYRMNCTTTGQSWTSTNSYTVTGTTVDYKNFDFDQTRFAGFMSNDTELQFTVEMLASDKSTVLASDLEVTGDAIKIDLPTATSVTISSISPDTQSAGTSSQVTITGTGFGATQGNGKVEFFYRSGEPKIAGSIISWSNTQIVCIVPVGTINNYPASAGSGPVVVTTSTGLISNEYNFKVTFSFGGPRWTVNTVNYRINENLSTVTGESQCIQNAANTWNNANANFHFNYAGTHTYTAAASNSNNDLCWAALSSSTTIGQASVWYSGGYIIECDIVFNNALAWNSGTSSVDIETIALHELGHWLNLRDLYGNYGDGIYDQAKAMYGFSYYGQTKRTLHSDDIAGIQWIYGMAESISISGYVRTATGAAVSGVLMSGLTGNPSTNANGFYTADVPIGFTGSVTPVKSGYTFSLASRTYSNQTSSLTDQDFTATLSNNDATLSDLKVSGTTVAGFSKTQLTYTVALPAGTITVPTVTATTSDANATKVITPATLLPGTSKVKVTAQDGATILVYEIAFTLPAVSSDATLSDLSVSGTTVAGFSRTLLTYNVQLPFGTTVVPTVTATTTDTKATKVITPAAALPGASTVQVTAEDGTTKITYTINFTLALPSADATLSDLKAGGTTVTGFASATLSYNVLLPYGTTVVPIVTATTTSVVATKVITPAASLPGTTNIVVTAQDGASTKTYLVNFTIAKNTDATLSDLKVSGNTVAGFVKTTTGYNMILPYGTSVVPVVTATTTDAQATRVITPATSLPGTTSIVVTAENGTTTLTYTVSFGLEGPSTESTLSDLKINGTTVSGFHAATLTYAMELPAGTVTVPVVTGTATSAVATVGVSPAASLPGTTNVQVTAQDGTTKKTYSVVFTLAKNTDASLSNLKVSGVTVTGFSGTTLAYSVILPFGTTVVPVVTADVTDANATRVITPAVSLPGTTSILVTAENGTTTQVYTISFSVDAGSTEATLSNLMTDGATVAGFNPSVTAYTVTLPYGTTAIPVVSATTSNANSTRVIHQASTIPGFASVVVTSESGTVTKTYTINFLVSKNSDASLSDLRVDGTTVSGFSRTTMNYAVVLPYGTTVVPIVSATPTDNNAIRNIAQAASLPGTATITVTAEDGFTQQIYHISFIYTLPSTDATLSSLEINGTTVTGFDPGSLNYQVLLPYGTADVPNVQATANHSRANVVIMRANALPGVTTIQVTAQDAVTTRTYTVNFSLAKNSDATLSDLTVDGITVPGFGKSSLTYSLMLPSGAVPPPVIAAKPTDIHASVEIQLPLTYPGTAMITVIAEDGITTNVYQIYLAISGSGVDDNSYQNKLQVYPNPNNGNFTFEYSTLNSNALRVSVLDVTGRVVFDHQYEGSRFPLTEQVQISDQQKGAYFVRVIDGATVSYRKIIVE